MREAKDIDCSLPSIKMLEMMAPMLYAEASPARVIGRDGSWCTSTWDEVRACLASANACAEVQSTWYCDSNLLSGCIMVARFGMNFP